MNYQLRAAAKVDLMQLFEYGIEAFGMEQALKYSEQLSALLAQLGDTPKIGFKRSDLGANVRQFPFKAHRIIYQDHGTEKIEVARILGNKMVVHRSDIH